MASDFSSLRQFEIIPLSSDEDIAGVWINDRVLHEDDLGQFFADVAHAMLEAKRANTEADVRSLLANK